MQIDFLMNSLYVHKVLVNRLAKLAQKKINVWAGALLKDSTYLSRHITSEKSGLCQYAVCITQNTML